MALKDNYERIKGKWAAGKKGKRTREGKEEKSIDNENQSQYKEKRKARLFTAGLVV